MASQVTRQQANEIVNKIRVKHGGLSAGRREMLETNDPEALEMITNLRKLSSSSVTALVQNLYSTKTRFLYEIIQNAEDNAYDVVKIYNEVPFLTFSLFPDRVVIDSNEDGFHESNVQAICAVNKSTKLQANGYIGEKGIGFKSVFKVAKKVVIHSEPFHFSFNYTRNSEDAGMGMVTPFPEEAVVLPPKVRTRMILMLQDGITYEQMEAEFREIPDTFLLFLQELKILKFEFHPQENMDIIESVTYSKRETTGTGIRPTYLCKSTSGNQHNERDEQKYFVAKSQLENLPFNEARVNHRTGSSIDHAEVVLAFPVDGEDVPVIKPQHTFAFLPLRRVGFTFLIQSDFVTLANREDIEYSQRNKAILTGVASLFQNAMSYFCKHPSLQWLWMRYLPDESISNDFWKGLCPLIRDNLKNLRLLNPLEGTTQYSPLRLCILPEGNNGMLDRHGSPLLADLTPPVYLSTKYARSDRLLLKQLGTTTLPAKKFIDLLRADVMRTDGTSRWKDITYDESWRTQLCDLISHYYGRKPKIQSSLRALPLVPTSLNNWWAMSGRVTHIYFPTVDAVPIPSDLGLELLHDAAVKNSSWANLMLTLGVTECSPQKVTDLLLPGLSRMTGPVTLSNAISHARWLFYFLPNDKKARISEISFFDEIQIARILDSKTTMYFPGTHDQFSPEALFEKSGDLPGYPALYLHRDYLDAVGPTVEVNGLTWLQWLEQTAGIRSVPRLFQGNPKLLSPEFQYLIENRKDCLLSTLKYYWKEFEPSMTQEIINQLKQSKILTLEGEEFTLENTCLPLPKLEDIVFQNGILDRFPFLPTNAPLQDEERSEWAFLERFNILIEDDLRFYLANLKHYQINLFDDDDPDPDPYLVEIYSKIQSKSGDDLPMVRNFFETRTLLYAQPPSQCGIFWAHPHECVWNGPVWLKSKRCLGIDAYQQLKPLFVNTLGIPDVCQNDILQDLLHLRNTPGDLKDVDIESLDNIYNWLCDNVSASRRENANTEDLGQMRESFEKYNLIYVPYLRTWRSPSQCVWAKLHVEIPEKASIAECYTHMKTFFTSKLKVEQPTKKMYISSLLAEVRKESATSELRRIMGLISNLKVTPEEVTDLRKEKVLPIRMANGARKFSSVTEEDSIDFAIVDRKEHLNAFTQKIAMLDLTLEEVRDTRPFLAAMGLEDRFSSELVQEITDVDGGRIDAEMTESLRGKAKAIVRCALQYAPVDQQKNTNSLFQILRRTTVYASSNIRKCLRITQDNKTLEGATTVSNFHLKELPNSLDIFVPEDELSYAMCFERQLPLRFGEYLCIPPEKSRSVLGSVFRMEKLVLVDKLLEEEGVGQIDCELVEPELDSDENMLINRTRNLNIQDDQRGDEDLPASTAESAEYASIANAVAHTTITNAAAYTSTANMAATAGYTNTASATGYTNTAFLTPSRDPEAFRPFNGALPPLDPFTSNPIHHHDTAYGLILQNVVTVARRRVASGLFETGSRSAEQHPTDDILSDSIVKEVFAARVPDHEFKLGAAGELYVFEYLKGLNLPSFGLHNWKSAIRGRVNIHPDYTGLANSSDRSAIADIEYADETGALTDFLIRRGYLDSTLWLNQRPKYHIEVKATHYDNWQEPFYVSKSQEWHIRNHFYEENETSMNVYMICRVLNVGRGKLTGFNVYINPELGRQKGQLEFTTHTWAVKPLRHTIHDSGSDSHYSTNGTETSLRSSEDLFPPSMFNLSAGQRVQASSGALPVVGAHNSTAHPGPPGPDPYNSSHSGTPHGGAAEGLTPSHDL